MKTLIRSFLINFGALWLVSQLFSGIVLTQGYETLAMAALALGLFNLLVKPILNIFFLPLNLLTMGTFRWLVNVATLYLVTMVVPGFSIISFSFIGMSYNGMSLPAFSVVGIPALILTSFVLSLVSSFFYWLVK
jgi:uncharacterized membrane protein YvlD (DUF360 family)